MPSQTCVSCSSSVGSVVYIGVKGGIVICLARKVTVRATGREIASLKLLMGPCDLEAAGSEIANLKPMGFRDLGAAVNEIANLKPMGLWDLWGQSAEKSQT